MYAEKEISLNSHLPSNTRMQWNNRPLKKTHAITLLIQKIIFLFQFKFTLITFTIHVWGMAIVKGTRRGITIESEISLFIKSESTKVTQTSIRERENILRVCLPYLPHLPLGFACKCWTAFCMR